MRENYTIGVDIGGTYVRIGAQKNDDPLTGFEKILRESALGDTSPIEGIGAFISDYLEKNFPRLNIDAVGIGFPSTLSKDRRTIYHTPNIEGLDNSPISDILEQKIKTPIFLEKDVNILFKWDIYNKRLPEKGIGLGIYFGTGIGNAITINGELLIGRDGIAGELGHVPVIGGSGMCGCGNSGCFECYASGRRLVELRESYFGDTEIRDLFSEHRDSTILKEFVEAMACVVATEINIFNPHFIILGGGIVNMKDFPRKLLDEYIYNHSRHPVPSGGLPLYYSDDSDRNGVLGSIYMARGKLNVADNTRS
ncbi:MAG: allose kinase [Spirochaetaceae bacterium]|jgi:allose kinase|nr:allose kinase [Spirochaetaceae bacterium]